MADETIEQLRADLATLTRRVEEIERELKSERERRQREDMQYRSAGGR